uniref:Jerky protein homolog-like n=1 Tax=Bactrocera dorsalis TaxID=27457 RepID=A0A034WUX8_BACDO
MKQISLKDAIITLESAWNKVDEAVLSKFWNNVLSMLENQEDPEDEFPLNILRRNLNMNVGDLEESAANLLQNLRPEIGITACNVREWNEDAIEFNENEIQEISDEDDYTVESQKTITAREAIDIFNNALKWAESEMVEQKEINVLKNLREKAVFKVVEQKKQQKRITDFFPK